MALAYFPGIRYDPREPPPPGFGGVNFQVANFARQQPLQDDGHGHPHPVPRHMPPQPRPRPWARRRDNFDQDNWDDDSEEDDPFFQVHRPQHRMRVQPQPQQEGFLAPLSSSVNVQIVHDTAKFTIVHLFNNQTDFIKQGVYQFPLPHEATVTEFNCRIGQNRIVHGKVKEKEDARREFDQAARQGRAGGLVEQQTAGVFTTTLANIPPDTKMRAELSFMCLLKHKVGGGREVFTLTIPTFIAPRYGDLPPGIRVGDRNDHFLGLDVDILTAEELISVNSDTHNIVFNRGNGQRPCQTWNDFVVRQDEEAVNTKTGVIQLEEGRTSLDKDLVIDITTAMSNEAGEPQALLEIHPTFDNHKALMLTIPSDFMLNAESRPHDGEIIFVADRSGSMIDKIESLKSAMMFFINGIPENRPFNIWCFGSGSTSMWPRSKPFNEATKREAMNYVRYQFSADMGGTDILPALENIYNARGGYHSMDIIVLTDGELWSPNETIEFVKQKWTISEGMIRFFSLGIGYAVSHQLVEGIAKAGGGYAEVIAAANVGGWEDRVVAVLKAATTGHIGPLHMGLEWKRDDGPENLAPPKYKISPSEISTISPFLRNRVFWLFDSGTPCTDLEAIVLRARGPNGVNITKRVVPKGLALPDATIHKLAVRALLGELERGESWLHRNRPIDDDIDATDTLVREEAVKLGCKWSLVSQWTSIFAVEEETQEPNEGMEIDIHLPAADGGVDDALLRPRGAVNMNADRLIGGPGPAEDNSESESDSNESLDPSLAPPPDTDDDSNGDDDDHSDPGNNTGNNPTGGTGGGGNDDQGGNDRGHDSDGHQEGSSTPEHTPPGSDHHGENATDSNTLAAAPDQGSGSTGTGSNEGSQPKGWDSTASWERSTHTLSASNLPPASFSYKKGGPLRALSGSSSLKWAKFHKSSKSVSASPRPAGSSSADSSHLYSLISGGASTVATVSSDVPALFQQAQASRGPQSSSASPAPPTGPSITPAGAEASYPRYSSIQGLSAASVAAPSSIWSTEYSVASAGSPNLGTISGQVTGASSRYSPSRYSPVARMARTASQSPPGQQPMQEHNYIPNVLYSPNLSSLTPDPFLAAGQSHMTASTSHSFMGSSYAGGHSSPIFSYESSAPVYNPPASTSLMHGASAESKSDEEKDASKFVRDLLVYQRSDGCFVLGNEDNVKTTLGSSFLSVVNTLKAKHDVFDDVVTIAIVALLEQQCQICQSLWVLMVRKARAYITSCAPSAITDPLMKEAEDNLGWNKMLMDEVIYHQRALAAVVDLECAPIA